MPLRVLVVDDESNIRKAVLACLKADGHEVAAAASAADALEVARRQSFDLAFLDLRLGNDSGLDLIPLLLADSPWMKIVVITAFATIDTAVESIRRGAADYLPKPFTPAQVGMITARIQQLRNLEQRVAGLQSTVDQAAAPELDFSTSSPAMQRAVSLARQVAASDATVLIRGESGTGKTMLAAAIHAWSPRAAKTFVTLALPSLSADLIESELFGHVRGAFTGAVRDNPGRLAAAEGGTLLLDEIGELPAILQTKLLRFVQDRQYERVGHTATRSADVRIIAATNSDLEKAVGEGRFREDLYYRLNVIQIELPPLRQRPEDVTMLAERLLALFRRRSGRGPAQISPAAAEVLAAYHWPGNVRELRNVIERATILCQGQAVGPEHLLLPSVGRPPAVAIGDPVPLERIEELHIRAVLAGAPSIDKAASILGMDTVTLWRRRRKYGI